MCLLDGRVAGLYCYSPALSELDDKAEQGIANPQQWKVKLNELGSIPRTVTTTPHSVTCDCEDFSGQSQYLIQHPYLWNVTPTCEALDPRSHNEKAGGKSCGD